ncbi:MAG: short-chain dehydrogenase [Leptospiraceae bacterium]|nr:MAG: short-chain dehydrogenase [Leptospiraceae bacterium]
MKQSYWNKVVILGATSDMAVAFSHLLAKKNISQILIGRNKEKLEAIAKDLQIRYQIKVDTILFDVEKDSPEQIIKKIPDSIDMFACFIGYLGDQKKAQTDSNEAQRIIKINYTMPAIFTEMMIEKIKQSSSKKRTIIGISSVAGDRGRQSNYFYGSAKAAYSTYLSGLRNRLFKEKIHVLTVKPGFVYTSMTENLNLPPLLTAKPEEVAKDIFKAAMKEKNVIYTKWFWKYIMLIIKYLPEFIFKRLSL